MDAVISAKDHYRAEFEQGEGVCKSAPWLRALRRQALDHFYVQGFPNPRHEDWRYTRTSDMEKRLYTVSKATSFSPPDGPVEALGPRLTFVDGHYRAALSQLDRLPAGVTVIDLATVLAEQPDLLQNCLGAVASFEHRPFTALNTAFLREGAYIHLSPGTTLDRPLHLVFQATTAQHGHIMHPHVVIVMGTRSRATVIEHYQGPNGVEYFTNTVTEAALDRYADLEHYRLQQEGLKAWHLSGTYVRQAECSRYASCSLALGGILVRNELDIALTGAETECRLSGLYLASGRQHMDHNVRVAHRAPRGRSRQLYRGVLDGQGRGAFDSRVIVYPGADKTDAGQSNRSLVLSPHAEADSKPQLEIYADDVKCMHGAAVGRLDQDALFYLRARGLNEATARGLLTYAFCGELFAEIKVAALRDRIQKAVLARLPQADLLGELM